MKRSLIHRHACAARAGLIETANDGVLTGRATIAGVVVEIVASTRAPSLTSWARRVSSTCALLTVGGRWATDIATSAAVVGIRIQDAALAIALHRALDASVETGPADALAEFKGTWVRTTKTATPAI